MDRLYSIGETAKIMGISVQTLRNYSNSSLLAPAFINNETGYRYFSFSQFHIIDRIKYLRSFRLSLSEIEQIMSNGKVDNIISFLENQQDKIDQQIQELVMTKEDIQWYVDYFKYLNIPNTNALPHVAHFPERTVLTTPCKQGESIEDIEVALASMKTEYGIHGMRFRRQFGYLLPYDSIISKNWAPLNYFIFVSEIGNTPPNSAHVFTIPAGDYLCFSFRLRHMDELNIALIQEYFKNVETPPYVIANEHEDNLVNYTYCPYELQFLLKTKQ